MSLQSRILVLFLVLLLLVLGGTLVTVSQATYVHSLQRAEEELTHGRQIFLDKLASRQSALAESASTLAKEDALRQAIFSDLADRQSVRVALNNHRLRTSADIAFLVELDGTMLADTAESRRQGLPFPFPELLRLDTGDAVRVVELDGSVYQVVCAPYYVPVSAPQPSLWLLLGAVLDDAFAKELHHLIGTDVTILVTPLDSVARAVSSSLSLSRRASLHTVPVAEEVEVLALGDGDCLALSTPLVAVDSPPIAGVITRPTRDALLGFQRLSGRFLTIALVATLLAATGAFVVARSVTRPVRSLEQAARRIAAGDYQAELPMGGGDEVGNLARELAAMQEEVRRREHAIHRLAYHDDVTDLANRNRFLGELTRSIETARATHGRLVVAVMDLDRFKDINDALGHHVGDRVLFEVARRLTPVAQALGAGVARLGDDEFGMLVPVRNPGEARSAIDRFRKAVTGFLDLDEVRVDIEASIGIVVCPDQGSDPAALLQQAEVAMYVAKQRRLGIAFYDSSLNRRSIERLSLVADLRRALEEDAIDTCFQPKLHLASGSVDQVEVLLRWDHPQLGRVSPAEFIPVAEQTGLIRDVTDWVLRRALEQVGTWEREGLDITVAVNISALDLYDLALPRRLQRMLRRTGVDAQRLVLEITESSVMADPKAGRRLLDEVTEMGASVSIDDFGTGYSSLAQLKRLPVRELKVDRSFITEIHRSSDIAQIVRSIVDLGHNLGLIVVAEGVESHEGLEAVRAMQCDLVQGYFVSEPLAAADLARWLRERRASSAVSGADPL